MLLAFMDFGGPGMVIFWFVAALVLLFELVMFVSAIRNKALSDTARVLWCVGMLLLHPFVAIAYYFTDYKKA